MSLPETASSARLAAVLSAILTKLSGVGCLVLGLLTACGGAVNGNGPAGGAGDSASAGTKAVEGTGGSSTKPKPGNGGAATGSAGSSNTGVDPVGGAGGVTGIDVCAPKRDDAPGKPLYDEMAFGAGECAKTSLAEVLHAIEALRPDLSDVSMLYAPDPDRGGDGSFRYAFAKPDGGFAVVFKRGDGDCPSGCITNDYWYFETGVGCDVQEVGETHRGGDGCIQADQLPRWGIPGAVPPSEICDADLSPQDLNGRYIVPTCGQFSSSCFEDKDKGGSQSLPSSITLDIQQDPADMTQGLVFLDGTMRPGLDGVPFAATFERAKLTVFVQASNLPSDCPEQSSLQLEYDFEGFGGRRLSFEGSSTPDCTNAPMNYCKSQVNAVFGDATRMP